MYNQISRVNWPSGSVRLVAKVKNGSAVEKIGDLALLSRASPDPAVGHLLLERPFSAVLAACPPIAVLVWIPHRRWMLFWEQIVSDR
jgi:hypothetical protein